MKLIWKHSQQYNEHYFSSSENKAWKKNSGLYWIWTHDLCDTGGMLDQLS